jgi:hypothetical protein
MSAMKKIVAAAALSVAAAASVLAQTPGKGKGQGQGPVITQCKDDIGKFCAGKPHDGEVRACLEARRAEVTAACRTALDTTGGGRGRKQ